MKKGESLTMIDGNNRNSSKKVWKFKLSNLEKKVSNNHTFITLITFLYVLPLFTNSQFSATRSTISLLSSFLILGIFALSFDFQLGRTGLLNFGQAAFFGVGAYITVWHLKPSILAFPLDVIFGLVPFPFTIFSAIAFGILLGLLMGSTTNRMKGTAFAFIALAVAMLLYEFMSMPSNLSISGGESGIRINTPSLMTNWIVYMFFVIVSLLIVIVFFFSLFIDLRDRKHILLLNFRSKRLASDYIENPRINNLRIVSSFVFTVIVFGAFLFLVIPNILDIYFYAQEIIFLLLIQYYYVLTITLFVYLFVKRVVNSPFGRVLAAIAQNDERMQALGYNVFFYRVLAVGLSGGLAALSGSLYATHFFSIGTESTFGIGQAIDVMLFTITGGLGTLLGPFIGASVIKFSEIRLVDFLESINVAGQWWLFILGVIFIIIILFFPYGIVGSIKMKTEAIKSNLRRWGGIQDNDYWWISLVLAFTIFYLMIIF